MSQTYKYIEIAEKSPRQRGLLIPKEGLSKYVPSDVAVYRSMYLYDEDAKDYVDSKSSIRDYYGKRDIDNILIDIDKKENSDEYTLKQAIELCFHLEDSFDLGYEEQYRAYFSGSGYHILIPNSVFNFKPGQDLPFQVRETMMKLFEGIDSMIYMRTGLYRLPHTLNAKTNLYKIPLTRDEVFNNNSSNILALAKTPRIDYKYSTLEGNGELENNVIKKIPRVRKLGSVSEPKKVATCIQTMYNRGPTTGSRHLTILRMVSHYRRNGIPSEAAKAAILHWNDGQLNEQEINQNVEYAYNKGYKYSCSDELMSKDCSPKCIFYKRKDYMIDVMNAEDMQKDLLERLSTDFTGRSYNLGKALGIEEECIFFPGDLVTIFGPTGSSKTTLAHNIALGYNHAEDMIDESSQIPTLYLSLELAPWYMHRRSLQIVSKKTKAEINSNFKEIFKQCKNKVSHMIVQSISPTLEQIQEKIRELQPAMVVVDYIDLIDTPHHVRGEYEKVKYISHGLSNMAVNLDILIVQVAQVSREYSRNEVLDLYAGKGSGAIENASRKVIGLNGQPHKKEKRLELFKNTDGELFSTNVEWTPSFRLRRTDD